MPFRCSHTSLMCVCRCEIPCVHTIYSDPKRVHFNRNESQGGTQTQKYCSIEYEIVKKNIYLRGWFSICHTIGCSIINCLSLYVHLYVVNKFNTEI